jgi:hypothetical protein
MCQPAVKDATIPCFSNAAAERTEPVQAALTPPVAGIWSRRWKCGPVAPRRTEAARSLGASSVLDTSENACWSATFRA